MFKETQVYLLTVTIPEGEYDAIQAWDVADLGCGGEVLSPTPWESAYRVQFSLDSEAERAEMRALITRYLERWS